MECFDVSRVSRWRGSDGAKGDTSGGLVPDSDAGRRSGETLGIGPLEAVGLRREGRGAPGVQDSEQSDEGHLGLRLGVAEGPALSGGPFKQGTVRKVWKASLAWAPGSHGRFLSSEQL